MSRINPGGVSGRNPFGPNWGKSTQSSQPTNVGDQMQQTLFGKKKPPIVDADEAHIAAQMARLHVYRKRLARLAGDDEDDYDLVLAEGTIAMIDAQGLIYIGKNFLENHMDQLDVLVGVLAHEIGHRPKRWAEYRGEEARSKEDAEELCRLEETRADYFAGKALAELKLRPEPLIRFLADIQVQPHPEYFSAKLRADVILEGFGDGDRQASDRKKFFPEFARMTGASGDLGTG